MKNIYLAAPLFSQAELSFNLQVCEILERYFKVYMPQRDGGLMTDMIKRGLDATQASKVVFEGDMAAIRKCDWLVAILDGRAIDEGVAVEIGLAFAIGKGCIGLQTDPRRLLVHGNNPMVENALSLVIENLAGLQDWAEEVNTGSVIRRVYQAEIA